MIGTGCVATFGIIVAEALYPGYDPTTQTISALGAAGPGGAAEPAATVFNASMVLSGLLVLAAVQGLWDADTPRWLLGLLAITGLGIAGVGLFPAHLGAIHTLAAFVTFAGGGCTAIAVGWLVDAPFRYVSALLGVIALLALVVFAVRGGANPLGIGGIERLITYPVQLWGVAVGAYLLGAGGSDGFA
jgi:hypothetical membrane protein